MKTFRAGPFVPLTLTDRDGPEWARPLPFYVGIRLGVRESRDEENRPKAAELAEVSLDGLPVLPQTRHPEAEGMSL